MRVVLLNQLVPSGPVVPHRDSGQLVAGRLQGDPVATRALDSVKPQHGAVTNGDTTYAEAARPGARRRATRCSCATPVELGSIQLVERRVLLAAGVALLIALLLGYGGARMFARRIRRLERAADRIANGRFDEPVVDTGGGELGALAAAFERMRVRLAHLDDARREFVANASHELRTPLFSLGGFLELLDDEELDEPTRREFLGSMREQVDRLTKLASDLLDLTRLDAGRLHGRTGAGRPGGAWRPTSSRSSGRSRARATTGSRWQRAASPSWPRPTSCGRCSSAGSWSRTRCCTRRGHAGRDPGAGARASTRCSRSRTRATGSREEQREQLFQRFFRLDGTRASGSGLGLAIAKQLAELMDGAIELDSRPGQDGVRARATPLRRARWSRFHAKRPFPQGRSYSATTVRLAPLVVVAVVCAVLGGLAALGIGELTGWTGSSSTTTVFRSAPVAAAPGTAATAAVAPTAKPLAGNGFSPSAIYANRAAGVVTIVSVFGSDPRDRLPGAGLRLRRLAEGLHPHELARDHRRRQRAGAPSPPTRSSSSSRIATAPRPRSSAGTSSTTSA